MIWYNGINKGINTLSMSNLALHNSQRNAKIYVATPRKVDIYTLSHLLPNIFRFLYLRCPFQLYTYVECTNVEPIIMQTYSN